MEISLAEYRIELQADQVPPLEGMLAEALTSHGPQKKQTVIVLGIGCGLVPIVCGLRGARVLLTGSAGENLNLAVELWRKNQLNPNQLILALTLGTLERGETNLLLSAGTNGLQFGRVLQIGMQHLKPWGRMLVSLPNKRLMERARTAAAGWQGCKVLATQPKGQGDYLYVAELVR